MTDSLRRQIDAINRERLSGNPLSGAAEVVEALFRPSTKLFIYGTLRPGAPNHHVLDGIAGDWIPATARGHLRDDGWGATSGYPAIQLDPKSADVSGVILISPDLEAHWSRLDAFEGEEYCRLLTLAQRPDGVEDVVNVYALRERKNQIHGSGLPSSDSRP